MGKLARVLIPTAAVLTSGLVVANCRPVVQSVAEAIAGGAPSMPERVPVVRPPMEVAIGVDVTTSKVSKQIPTIVGATADYVDDFPWVEGDKVRFCEVGGEGSDAARCTDYVMPNQEGELITRIRGTEAVEFKSPFNYTRLRDATAIIATGMKEPCMISVWTDGMDMAVEEQRSSVDPGDCEVQFLIPDASYQKSAESVASAIEGGSEVVQAKTGSDVSGTLGDKTKDLQDEAQRKADEEADAEHKAAMDAWEKARVEIMAKAESIRKKVQLILNSLCGLSGLGFGTLLTYMLRPRARGYAYVSQGPKKPTTVSLAYLDAMTIDLGKQDGRFPNVVFKATWGGEMTADGKTVKDGDFVGPDGQKVYYSDKKLKPGDKKEQVFDRLIKD